MTHLDNKKEGGGADPFPPLVDLSNPSQDKVIAQIATACSTFGFFQVINHGVSEELISSFRECCLVDYFRLPHETKVQWKRNQSNARGFFDDELTKQKRDWKECLDVGVPNTRDWAVPDESMSNHCLDGYNQLPPADVLPKFRPTLVKYFDECAELSHRIAVLMAKGLGEDESHPFIRELRSDHSSYLRTNYYPPCTAVNEDTSRDDIAPLGISPHKDAGFLTVLLQDEDCHSLQVQCPNDKSKWITVHPVPGSFTINTGDMCQIWSNGLYKAPLHRVLTNRDKMRYSAPFFYNPPYTKHVAPTKMIGEGQGGGRNAMAAAAAPSPPRYHPCLWGYFRAVRFAGDLTDLGVEIQIDDYEIVDDEKGSNGNNQSPPSKSQHIKKQAVFESICNFSEPFSVEKYRDLLLRQEE